MLSRLLLLFLLIFIGELMLLLWLADKTSWNLALGEVLLTGAVGTMVVRWQGAWTLKKVERKVNKDQSAGGALLDGFLIFVAGLFLITPGLITDVLGLLLLIPPCRTLFKAGFLIWFMRRFKMSIPGEPRSGSNPTEPSRRIIDVEVVDHSPEDARRLDDD